MSGSFRKHDHDPKPRVAVIGARGIGKHHARWWHLAGARVCAVVGRSRESAAAAAAYLQPILGTEIRAYDRVDVMLEVEHPQIVDVCSPPEAHEMHVHMAVEFGCDVLCEKPLLFDESLSADDMIGRARRLADRSRQQKVRFALSSQYAPVASEIRRIYCERRGSRPIRRFIGHLCSPARGRMPCPARTWIDLGPHLLAAAQTLTGGGWANVESLRWTSEDHCASVALTWTRPDGTVLECAFMVDHREEEPANIRRFALDDLEFEVVGETGPDGQYGARYICGDFSLSRPDPLRVLIADYLAGQVWLGAEDAVENQRVLLRIWERLSGERCT